MKSYKELLADKRNGKSYDWSKITRSDLFDLSHNQMIPDNLIGNLYSVMKNTVEEKRREWGITGYTQNK